MDILLNLPQHLALDIVRDWAFVDLRDVSALDVAHSNRGEFLDLLGQLPVTWDMSKKYQETISKSLKRPTGKFLDWMQARCLNLSTILVHYPHIADLGVPFGLSSVTRLMLAQDEDSCYTNISQLGKVFPSVILLDFSRWHSLTDYNLYDMLGCKWKLKSLNLQRLQELLCDQGQRLDDLGIWRLTMEGFNHLTKLALDVCTIVELDRVVELCSINLKLEHLSLDFANGCDPTILGNAITAIAQSCTNLRTAKLFSELEFDDILMKFGKFPNGQRYWEFTIENVGFTLIARILRVIDNHELPLRALKLSSDSELTAEFIELIADLSGPTLEKLHCNLIESTVEPATMLRLFQNCHALQELSLSYCTSENVSAVVLNKLPDFCPHLRYLTLVDFMDDDSCYLDDDIIIAMLKGFSEHAKIERLHFESTNLTDAVLNEIVNCLPNVKKVGLGGTQVTAEAILQVIVEGRLKDAVICPGRVSHKAWICDRLRELGLDILQVSH